MNFREKCRSEVPEAAVSRLKGCAKVDNLYISTKEPEEKTGFFMTAEPRVVKQSPEVVLRELVNEATPQLLAHVVELHEKQVQTLIPCLKQDKNTVINIISAKYDFDLNLYVYTYDEGMYGLNLQLDGGDQNAE